MKIKIALIVSAFLTVILLTVVGSVVAATSQKNVSATATASQSVSMNATKEAAYLQLIAQANQTIDQANQEITALTAQSQGQTNPTASPYPILADQAAAIASKTTGETPTKTPELVNFSGKVAYEVTFRNGKVYIDATSGAVLYNGIQVVHTITSDQAAQIAIQYTGNSQVVEVVSGLYNGASAFRVTFQNGEIVYIDTKGTILAVQLPSSASNGSNAENNNESD